MTSYISKKEAEEKFAKWRDTQGGWPSRTECFDWCMTLRSQDIAHLIEKCEGMKEKGIACRDREYECDIINTTLDSLISYLKTLSNE